MPVLWIFITKRTNSIGVGGQVLDSSTIHPGSNLQGFVRVGMPDFGQGRDAIFCVSVSVYIRDPFQNSRGNAFSHPDSNRMQRGTSIEYRDNFHI
jgi:hypothetical protein